MSDLQSTQITTDVPVTNTTLPSTTEVAVTAPTVTVTVTVTSPDTPANDLKTTASAAQVTSTDTPANDLKTTQSATRCSHLFNHTDTADLVSNICNSRTTQLLLEAYGLNACQIAWEDTARTKHSCFGPNISDMTLVTKNSNRLMPVIRKPNFSDITEDVPIEHFRLKYKGSIISLETLLKKLNVYNERDSVVLTSNQCCVLPAEAKQKTQFAVQLFNYQSVNDGQAVAVILASKQGTSIQLLDSNKTKLFHNNKGTAHWFTAERLEDVRTRQNASTTKVKSFKEMTVEERLDNSLMVIQVPLIPQHKFTRSCNTILSDDSSDGQELLYTTAVSYSSSSFTRSRGMDLGQIGLGDEVGPYTGTKGKELNRDAKFPIRCTFQYYRVTDKSDIDEKDILDIKEQLSQSSKVAVNQGSLVLGTSDRVTEPVVPPAAVVDPWKTVSGTMATFA